MPHLIDFSTLQGGPRGEAFEALVRHLGEAFGLKALWSGRGADEGQDLIFLERQAGPLGETEIRWLVQCKDFFESGRSVSEADVGSILDKVSQHAADGFFLATTTTPSTGLKKLLDSLATRGIIQVRVWDGHEIKMRLNREEATYVRGTYFPDTNAEISRLETIDVPRIFHGLDTTLYAVANNISALEFFLGKNDDNAKRTSRKLIDDAKLFIDELRFVMILLLGPQSYDREATSDLSSQFVRSVIQRAAAHFSVGHVPLIPIAAARDVWRKLGGVNIAEGAFELIMFNLVSNAVKYSRPEQYSDIRITIETPGNEVHFIIEDRDLGIPKADLERVFQRGYRGTEARRFSIRGLGLGLSTSREIVEQFGGHIGLSSENGITRFLLVFRRGRRE